LPPVEEVTVHVVWTSVTPFRIDVNCSVPPAGSVEIVGLMEYPCVTLTVTVAVFEVTVDVLLLPVVAVCCATAVMFTTPLFVVGTVAGAV
jgi:hypothetical protein